MDRRAVLHSLGKLKSRKTDACTSHDEVPSIGKIRDPRSERSRRSTMILAYIVIGLAILLAVLIAIVAMQPSEFRIARSATMSAPAPAVFAQVNDFHNWQ